MAFKIFNISPLQENRDLAPLPQFSFSRAGIFNYAKNYEDYFNDHFGFREIFIIIANHTDYKLFKHSNNPDVIIGKNDYLFYAKTLNDYNKISLTDENISVIASKLELLQNELKRRNIRFLFFVAPNKNTIYPEFMPKESKNYMISNYEKLAMEMNKRNINFIDLKPYFEEQKSNYNLYYKRDTHWNLTAAALVGQILLEKLGYADIPRIVSFESYSKIGDLDKMLGFNNSENALKPVFEYRDAFSKLPKTIWYRDSFSVNLLPYISPYFLELQNYHYASEPFVDTFPPHMANTELVVFEVVERDIPSLLNYDFSICDTW